MARRWRTLSMKKLGRLWFCQQPTFARLTSGRIHYCRKGGASNKARLVAREVNNFTCFVSTMLNFRPIYRAWCTVCTGFTFSCSVVIFFLLYFSLKEFGKWTGAGCASHSLDPRRELSHGWEQEGALAINGLNWQGPPVIGCGQEAVIVPWLSLKR